MSELPFKISQSKKDAGIYCCAYSCKNEAIYKKNNLCHKHYARKIRVVDPVGSRYNQFKNNAIRRNKPFTITIDQFREFCTKTGYIITKFKRGRNATIDRINNNLGYHIDNIQLLTQSQNLQKFINEDRYVQGLPF